MLSKDEILKKKGKSPQQLDLVADLDNVKNKFKSRLLLTLFLFLFVGSSASLWIYREYKSGSLSINLPQFKFSHIPTPIVTDSNAWQICLFNQDSKSLLFSQNCKTDIIPDRQIKNNIDLIKNNLPNGLIIVEQIATTSSEINYSSTISSPKFPFLLTIKIFGSYPLDSSQNLIPKIASDLYWKYSQK